jgi:flagellar assembly factor FliW
VPNPTFETSQCDPAAAAERSVIEFPHGLIGLPGTRYELVESNTSISWLQSLDVQGLAVPVTNPFRFFEDYVVELSEQEAARLTSVDVERTSTHVTVRHDHGQACLVLNLRAPIIIGGGRGYQVINQVPEASLRAPTGALDGSLSTLALRPIPKEGQCSSSPDGLAKRSCSVTTSSSR